jgi:hypothetical protein
LRTPPNAAAAAPRTQSNPKPQHRPAPRTDADDAPGDDESQAVVPNWRRLLLCLAAIGHATLTLGEGDDDHGALLPLGREAPPRDAAKALLRPTAAAWFTRLELFRTADGHTTRTEGGLLCRMACAAAEELGLEPALPAAPAVDTARSAPPCFP